MLHQSKKDYLQRLIEEFFARFHELLKQQSQEDTSGMKRMISDCFDFFSLNFDVKQSDTSEVIIQKIKDAALLEQYAKLLLLKYQVVDIKEIGQLYIALDIVTYLESSDKTYSWDRVTLREDLLRYLDENNINN